MCAIQLLVKDPAQRLGCGKEGISVVKQHPFFANIDWKKLYAKKIKPPIVPQVSVRAHDLVHYSLTHSFTHSFTHSYSDRKENRFRLMKHKMCLSIGRSASVTRHPILQLLRPLRVQPPPTLPAPLPLQLLLRRRRQRRTMTTKRMSQSQARTYSMASALCRVVHKPRIRASRQHWPSPTHRHQRTTIHLSPRRPRSSPPCVSSSRSRSSKSRRYRRSSRATRFG